MSTENDGQASGVVRSCKNCPSFLKSSKVEGFFGKATSMDHCARFGTILGTSEMHPRQAEGLRRHTAKSCHDYGMPAPARPIWTKIEPKATLPSREALMAEQGSDGGPEYVSSCKDCIFYNRSGAEQAGLKGGAICASRMEFIFDGQTSDKAVGCGSAIKINWSAGRQPIKESIRLVPALVDAFYKVQTPLERWRTERENFVDPSEYPTDRPLTKDDVDRGLRAWRELVDVETGNSVFMPIYDVKLLPEDLRDLVPQTGDDEHPENFIDYDGLVFVLAALWYELDETPTLWGFPGTGKTEILRHMAWLMQLPFHRISITASTELEELVGQFALRGNETSFVHGRLPRAWRSPGVICLDEPNVGPPEVWQAIRPLTDNSKQFVIDKNAGEVIHRHPDSFLGLAMNPAWDTRNIGADMIADADSSRLAHLLVDYPPEDVEREIMREWANEPEADWEISDSMLDQIVTISTVLRDMSQAGTLSISWGVRHNIKVAKAARIFSLQKAYAVAVGNFLDPSERQALYSAVGAHIA